MPTFNPPTSVYADKSGDWLLEMMSHAHGITVYSLDGGATFTSTEFPYIGDLASVDPITSAGSGPSANAAEGVTYFLGGHVYTVTAAIAIALIDAGFGAGVQGLDAYVDQYVDEFSYGPNTYIGNYTDGYSK